MKWTLANIIYVLVGCLLITGVFHQAGLQWMGNAFVVIDILVFCIAFLKYLNGDHLQ